MVDTVDAETRSRIMRSVHSKDSRVELTVRRAVHSMGYRYRLHRADLPGTPDLVFSSRRKVIFVHGCFWHAHSGCKRASVPDQNHQYWEAKLASNVERDRKAIATLRKIGWHSLVIWECQIADEAKVKRKIARFLDY